MRAQRLRQDGADVHATGVVMQEIKAFAGTDPYCPPHGDVTAGPCQHLGATTR